MVNAVADHETTSSKRKGLSWYTDLGFITLAVVAIVVLSFQFFKASSNSSETSSSLAVSDLEAAAHFGGRVSMVVTSPAAYVVRADGTRFDTGAQLPGGYVLDTISDTELSLQSSSGRVVVSIP